MYQEIKQQSVNKTKQKITEKQIKREINLLTLKDKMPFLRYENVHSFFKLLKFVCRKKKYLRILFQSLAFFTGLVNELNCLCTN